MRATHENETPFRKGVGSWRLRIKCAYILKTATGSMRRSLAMEKIVAPEHNSNVKTVTPARSGQGSSTVVPMPVTTEAMAQLDPRPARSPERPQSNPCSSTTLDNSHMFMPMAFSTPNSGSLSTVKAYNVWETITPPTRSPSKAAARNPRPTPVSRSQYNRVRQLNSLLRDYYGSFCKQQGRCIQFTGVEG